jgi:hypothetical protein
MRDEILAAQLAARDKALKTLDMEYARKIFPPATPKETCLIALHKARFECISMSDEDRIVSREYLKSGGHTRMFNQPWPDNEELPK